ncbi:hypothetical protein ACHAW5_010414 [Stephanodiscus triporus]|uniref:Altered inheritance of mitochondria protein 24, mitochondrial n=1 Tax=Stephanodiscus triporus TaxID=2934178 RepID=A0ABD3PAC1_9STRA
MGTHYPTTNGMLMTKKMTTDLPIVEEKEEKNGTCPIIVGIGGKVDMLINIDMARDDGVLVLQGFTGEGMVVVERSSLWTTLIVRNGTVPNLRPYPQEIMEWSTDLIFGPAFEKWNEEAQLRQRFQRQLRMSLASEGRNTLVFQGKSYGLSGGDGRSLTLPPPSLTMDGMPSDDPPTFCLRKNNYILGDHKVDGNAQSIDSGGFLHHTSFLWDRGGGVAGGGGDFLFLHMKNAIGETFRLEDATLGGILKITNDRVGGLQGWFDGKCRTKVLQL